MGIDNLNYCTMQLAKRCSKKQGMLPATDFYTSNNTGIYSNGKFNICKHCLKAYIYEDTEINVARFKTILRIFDLPYVERDFRSALEGKAETFGSYMRSIQLNHKGETWTDGEVHDSSTPIVSDVNVDDDKIKNLVKVWGKGFSEDDLLWLDDNYNEWILENDSNKIAAKKLIRRICIKELELRKADECGEDTGKLEKSLLELMNNSNLTPKSSSNNAEDDSAKCWGEFIRDIEKYRPAEYFEKTKLYEDEQGIMDYYNRFILRPLKNLLLGNREFDKEFNVEDTRSSDE